MCLSYPACSVDLPTPLLFPCRLPPRVAGERRSLLTVARNQETYDYRRESWRREQQAGRRARSNPLHSLLGSRPWQPFIGGQPQYVDPSTLPTVAFDDTGSRVKVGASGHAHYSSMPRTGITPLLYSGMQAPISPF